MSAGAGVVEGLDAKSLSCSQRDRFKVTRSAY
jgi:hypothetical protein